MFSKILAPVEFDENAPGILRVATHLADQAGGSVFLMHVVRPSDPFQVSGALILAQLEEKARRQLASLAREYLQGVAHVIEVRVGFHPASVIIATAQEWKAELIVMATHGRKGVARLVLGSVAEHVVRGAPCPVFTLRPESHPRAVEGTAAH